MEVLLYEARRVLVVAHAVSAGVLLGAATHHAIAMARALRGRAAPPAAERRWATVAGAAFLATAGLGALVYPTYRVHVRAGALELHEPTLTRLFDVKEMFVALSLVPAVAVLALGRARAARDPAVLPLYAGASFVTCAVAWWSALVGLSVAAARGVG